jgi:hypothetical protein
MTGIDAATSSHRKAGVGGWCVAVRGTTAMPASFGARTATAAIRRTGAATAGFGAPGLFPNPEFLYPFALWGAEPVVSRLA